MSKFQITKWMGLLALLVAIVFGGYIAVDLVAAKDDGGATKKVEVLEFDVAEDMTRFVMDEAPVFEASGLPAHGNPFVTVGYIYPKGTLDGSNGVLENGQPEFPDKVLGTWVCRGWFYGDAAEATSGPWVITTQVYEFGEELGNLTLVTDGFELADVGKPIMRPITGGTGDYSSARGQAAQTFLGFNASEGVDLSFKIEIEK